MEDAAPVRVEEQKLEIIRYSSETADPLLHVLTTYIYLQLLLLPPPTFFLSLMYTPPPYNRPDTSVSHNDGGTSSNNDAHNAGTSMCCIPPSTSDANPYPSAPPRSITPQSAHYALQCIDPWRQYMIRSDPTGTSLHYLHFHIFFIAICGWMPRVADKQPGNDDVYFAFNLGVDQPNIFSMILFLFVLLFFSHFGIPSFLFFY